VLTEWDVVVVGAGTAGCPLAARLADAGRRVLLLEAGEDHPQVFPPLLRDAATMGAAVPGAAQNWDLGALLTDGVPARVPRGRVVGGSSAVYAGSFLRGTPADFDGWAADGNDLWSYARVLPVFRRLEADRDVGDSAVHGGSGPMPVTRPREAHPLADAFAAAVAALGFPAEPDKNAGEPPGYGPVPFGVADGVRVNTAMAYLTPRRGRAELTVRGGVRVRRVLVEHGRAVGVATDTGTVRAGEVVLSAGAVESAHLLLRSGIGPAPDLRAAGIPVLADLPVGTAFTDHPALYLGWRPARPLPVPVGLPPLHGVLHATGEGPAGADLEVLPWLAPFSRVMRAPSAPVPPGDDELALGLALSREESRGVLRLGADPDAPPRIEYRYLGTDGDRRAMRAAVRLAAEVLRTPPLAGLVAARSGPPDDVLADDHALDGWIRRHLSTAVHLSGTARMGPDGVVDQHLRVRGVERLRVADTSVFPQVTSRGPAATAVMLGERAADLMTGP
jgi:predicted dehydrogenase (TIGR03970 family)